MCGFILLLTSREYEILCIYTYAKKLSQCNFIFFNVGGSLWDEFLFSETRALVSVHKTSDSDSSIFKTPTPTPS
jgi:hypothetical protein